MVAWNSTEAEFDEEKGEIVLISRHKLQDSDLKLKTGAKLAKCVGAVSILFVKSEADEANHGITLTSNDSDKVIVSLPASLSVVSVPCPNFIPPPDMGMAKHPVEFPTEPAKDVPRQASLPPASNRGNVEPGWVQQEMEAEDDPEKDHETDELWTSEDAMMSVSNKKTSQSNQVKKITKKTPAASSKEPSQVVSGGLKQKLDSITMPQKTSLDLGIEIRGTFKGKKTLFNRKSTGPNKCKYCRKVINSWESIVEHALEDHGMISEDSDEVACPICKGLFSKRNMSAFIQHIQLHDKNWQNMCEEDPAMYLQNSSELNLCNVQDQDSDLEDFEGEMSLDGEDLSDSDQQGSSKRKRGGNRSFPRLNARMTSEVLQCTECAEQVSSYSDILHHCKLHDLFKQCPVCSKQFTLRGGLLRHFITHIDNRVFTCPSCDAFFTRKDNLKRHMERKCVGGPGSGLVENIGVIDKPPITQTSCQGKRFKPNPKERLILKFGKKWPSKQFNTSGLVATESSDSLSDYGTPDSSIDNISENMLEQDFTDMDAEIKMEPQPDEGEPVGDDLDSREDASANPESYQDKIYRVTDSAPASAVEGTVDVRPALSYKCATCDINFNTIQELKRHIVREHTEETPSTSSAQLTHDYNRPEETHVYDQPDEEDIKPDLPYPDSNHFPSVQYRYIQDQESDIGVQKELSAIGVIDIESLSKFADVEEDSNEKSVDDSSQSLPAGASSSGFHNAFLGEDSSRNPSQASEEGSDDMLDFDNSSDSNLLGVDSPDPSASLDSYTERNPDFFRTIGGVPKGRKGAVNKTAPICNFCGLVFNRALDILHHGEVHELELSSQSTCTICLKELSGKDSLLRHANSHIGRWYPCDVCTASFSRKDNLKRHKRKHEEEEGGPDGSMQMVGLL